MERLQLIVDNLISFFRDGTLKVIVKPSSSKTEIIGWDNNRNCLKLSVAAAPNKGKANVELIKFLHRKLGKKVRIVGGARSREKIVKIV